MRGQAIVSGGVKYHPALGPLLVPIEKVSPYPENPSNGDEEALEESILINGMYRPVYCQESTGYVLAGNTTYATCLGLGASVLPVIWLDVDDDEALRIVLGDNQIARLAWIDRGRLGPQLDYLNRTQLGLLGTGYSSPPPPPPPPEPGHSISVYLTGDLMVSWFDIPADTDRERIDWLMEQFLAER